MNKIVGVDLDPQAQKFYEENNIPFFQNLDMLEDNSFDSIVSFHVLEHVPDPIKQLKILQKKIKSGDRYTLKFLTLMMHY